MAAGERPSSIIAGVSLPVNVFCWLGWYVPMSRLRADLDLAPCPNRGFARRAGGPFDANARSAASQPNAPSATTTRTRCSSASSRARNGAQVSRSSGVGLLAGGAQRTAAAM